MATPEESGDDGTETTSVTNADDALDRAAVRTTVAFTDMGFAPELVAAVPPMPRRERIIRLHACPVRDLARTRPEVVCEVHRGLLEGLLDKPATAEGVRRHRRQTMKAHLAPLVEPELCVVTLAAGE